MLALLEEAYRRADYLVSTPCGIVRLQVGMAVPGLESILDDLQCTHCAVITAANPRSQLLSPALNAARNALLATRLESLAARQLPACARDPRGDWPEEPGYLALDITHAAALLLAREFEQLAILWCESGHSPRLSWTGIDAVTSTRLDQQCGEHGTEA